MTASWRVVLELRHLVCVNVFLLSIRCCQACVEIAFNVVTPLLQTVTIGSVLGFAFAFVLLLLSVSALATSNWVCCRSVLGVLISYCYHLNCYLCEYRCC